MAYVTYFEEGVIYPFIASNVVNQLEPPPSIRFDPQGPARSMSKPSCPSHSAGGVSGGNAPPVLPWRLFGPSGAKLFVCRLPKNYAECDFRALFRPYGTILSCRLVFCHFTGLSKRYGFISYDSAEAAQAV